MLLYKHYTMSKIIIIGSGMVGGATGKGFASLSHDVLFMDNQQKILNSLKEDGYKIDTLENIHTHAADIIFLCLPTPTKEDGVDTSIVLSVLPFIAQFLQKCTQSDYPIITLRSTVPIGTTKNIITKLEELSKKKYKKDFGVCFNPEYLREIHAENDFATPRLVLLGSEDSKTTEVMTSLYETITNHIFTTLFKEAEMNKYIHNLFNACKISFFNEQRKICKVLDINPEVIFPLVSQSAEASWNHEYGIKDLGAFGGSCLPKDTDGFLKFAKQHHLSTPLLEAIITVNKNV